MDTATGVQNDLNESLDKARESVSYLVSRNTEELTESFIISATIESLTENITDSYIAPIFYYFITFNVQGIGFERLFDTFFLFLHTNY